MADVLGQLVERGEPKMSMRFAAGLLVCGAALLTSPALAEPPHIRVGEWQSQWGQAACLERVEEVMRSVGFVDDLDVDHDDVEGNQGDYSAETICREDGLVLAIVAGPDWAEAGRLRDGLLQRMLSLD